MTYAIAYRFELLDPSPLNEEMFVQIWARLTDYFKVECGALGSRLHKTGLGEFHAYAQWPSKSVMEAAGDVEPTAEFLALRMKWADLCAPSDILFEGDILKDMFVS